MIIVTPSFNLNGRCEIAIYFYEKAFRIKTRFILSYADADERDQIIVERKSFHR
jgi:uncharacterized glyoxalase superfamily protein PhnB